MYAKQALGITNQSRILTMEAICKSIAVSSGRLTVHGSSSSSSFFLLFLFVVYGDQQKQTQAEAVAHPGNILGYHLLEHDSLCDVVLRFYLLKQVDPGTRTSSTNRGRIRGVYSINTFKFRRILLK